VGGGDLGVGTLTLSLKARLGIGIFGESKLIELDGKTISRMQKTR
jgi:hypothetical protein